MIGETIKKWQVSNRGNQVLDYILNSLSKTILEGAVAEDDCIVYHNSFLLTILFNTLYQNQVN